MLTLPPAGFKVTISDNQDRLVIENHLLSLSISRRSRDWSLSLGDGEATLSRVFGEARLSDGRLVRTTEFTKREISQADVKPVHDQFGEGVKVSVHDRNPTGPELTTDFWVYQNRPELFVRLDVVDPAGQSTNYISPIALNYPIKFKHGPYPQRLFVPYDNDSYFRYRSDGPGDPKASGSYEVGAAYDDASRNGLVVGSIDHTQWKSAVRFGPDENSLLAFAGVADKFTHDTLPHGSVNGSEVRSPRMVIGWYADWRDGMERYADLNANVSPPLAWKGPVPFGWNSWAGHKEKVTASDANTATLFFAKDLPKFRSGNTAYINFDSFWDNLTLKERAAFVKEAHSSGLRAGIYYSPFAGWSKLTDRVAGSSQNYSDLVLRDAQGNPVPQVDGAWPLDPTQPETIARIDRQLDEFVKLGFDFVKLDFMTLGALEGRHADPAVTTGTEAYIFGMRHILDRLSEKRTGRPIFLSLSIAPMFPQGFGHSRRISCDVFANIGATEYLLNSETYGWWTNRKIYQFNDPDATCVYEPRGEPAVSESEARCRFTATIISGGMLLDGDDLTKPAACDRVQRLFRKTELIDLSRRALAFRPVFADTGDKAGDTFEWVDKNAKTAYVAIFNYSKTDSVSKSIDFKRLGLSPSQEWRVHNLWTGENSRAVGAIRANLGPTDCLLVRLRR